MIIPLSRRLRIVATDGQNFVLERRHVCGPKATVPGSTWWECQGYYPSLELAAHAAIRKELAEGNERVSASALCAAIREAGQLIARACELAPGAAESAASAVTVAVGLPDSLFDGVVA